MNRQKITELIAWKNRPNRKPLIIKGARQVGKTWLIKDFGRNFYEQMVYINFEKSKRFQAIFADDFNVSRIVQALQIETGLTINPENTLIVFDEIQAVPEVITSLKYFCEDAPEYHIIAAGSLLGVALHSNISFPVGKVEFLNLYPLNFLEFLEAVGESGLVGLLQNPDWSLIKAFKSKFTERLRHYYFLGGMPEVVSAFAAKPDFQEARKIQLEILTSYEQDFSKHAPPEIVPRIRMAWNSIPSQLAKENRKFIYGLIKEGSRAREFELALAWLADCGNVHKVFRVSKPDIPLKSYEDAGAFKLFVVDIGLLSAMYDLNVKTLLEGNLIFTEFKGALTEQFVLQQFVSLGLTSINYWSADRSTAEVDFVVQYEGQAIPVEVKAMENLKGKSLKVYHEKYSPSRAFRASMSDYRISEWLTNLPLYAINLIKLMVIQ